MPLDERIALATVEPRVTVHNADNPPGNDRDRPNYICHRSRGILWRVKRHRRSSEWATNGTFIPLINSGKIAEVYQRRQLSLKADVMIDRAFAQM